MPWPVKMAWAVAALAAGGCSGGCAGGAAEGGAEADEPGTPQAAAVPPAPAPFLDPLDEVRLRITEPEDPRQRGPGALTVRVEVHREVRLGGEAYLAAVPDGWSPGAPWPREALDGAAALKWGCDGPKDPDDRGCTVPLVAGAELVLPPVDGDGRQCGEPVAPAGDPEPRAVVVTSCEADRASVVRIAL